MKKEVEKEEKIQIKVTFSPEAEEKLDELKKGGILEKQLYKHIMQTVDVLSEFPKKGRYIKKEILKKSKKYREYKNLYVYGLPGAWRLLYTIKQSKIVIEDVILDWGDHKWYNKEFGFKSFYPGFFNV